MHQASFAYLHPLLSGASFKEERNQIIERVRELPFREVSTVCQAAAKASKEFLCFLRQDAKLVAFLQQACA
jgi:hypothetical protein